MFVLVDLENEKTVTVKQVNASPKLGLASNFFKFMLVAVMIAVTVALMLTLGAENDDKNIDLFDLSAPNTATPSTEITSVDTHTPFPSSSVIVSENPSSVRPSQPSQPPSPKQHGNITEDFDHNSSSSNNETKVEPEGSSILPYTNQPSSRLKRENLPPSIFQGNASTIIENKSPSLPPSIRQSIRPSGNRPSSSPYSTVQIFPTFDDDEPSIQPTKRQTRRPASPKLPPMFLPTADDEPSDDEPSSHPTKRQTRIPTLRPTFLPTTENFLTFDDDFYDFKDISAPSPRLNQNTPSAAPFYKDFATALTPVPTEALATLPTSSTPSSTEPTRRQTIGPIISPTEDDIFLMKGDDFFNNDDAPVPISTQSLTQLKSTPLLESTAPAMINTSTFPPTKREYPDLRFHVLGDIPYNRKEQKTLTRQLKDIDDATAVDRNNSLFVIHVGDLMSAFFSKCREEKYMSISDIFRNTSIPVLTVPGDNEWNKCPNISSAIDFYKEYFVGIENNWKGTTLDSNLVTRSKKSEENWAFSLFDVLFLGINMVTEQNLSDTDINNRLQDNVDWFYKNCDLYCDTSRAIVIFGHSISQAHVVFEKIHQRVESFNIPVVYFAGNFHKYNVVRGVGQGPLPGKYFWRVQLDNGARAPPIHVTIRGNNDESRKVNFLKDNENQIILADMIKIDRQGGRYAST